MTKSNLGKKFFTCVIGSKGRNLEAGTDVEFMA